MDHTRTEGLEPSGAAASQKDPPVARPSEAVEYMDRTRRLYASQRPYRWREHDRDREPIPWTPIDGPLTSKRVALISSGGVHLADQEPFHFRNDISVREVPMDTAASDLRVAHFGYDTADAKQDPACVLPIRALNELAIAGEIGSVVDRAISFMGGVYSQRLVEEDLAPRLLDFVRNEEVDLVLLVPV
jgi:D-proline reductase (dithiol) PrdB